MTASTDPVPDVAADDRVQPLDSPLAFARRRLDGRFQIDAFGGDAQLMDLAGRALALGVRVDVEHAERIPRLGGALVVANRGLGLFEPAALAVAVRQTVGRRLRVIGAPDLPVLGDVLRKIGAVGYRPDDVAVLVRAGHLAAAPLAPTWLRSGAGAPPRELLAAIVGFPVVPAVVLPGGPGPLPIRPWRVIVGPVVETATDAVPGDTLAGAELVERTRTAVNRLLEAARALPVPD
ncbi:MAG TPA: hypothetical protein VKH36_13725 [Acidimicrobiia bacterium]|nr:hypothetical protein [Acidimicrobiia bacterium]